MWVYFGGRGDICERLWCSAADLELPSLQLVLVQLVPQDLVVPVELVEALLVPLRRLIAALGLRAEGIDLLLPLS